MAEEYTIMYMYHIFTIHSFIENPGLYSDLAIVIWDELNIEMQVSV